MPATAHGLESSAIHASIKLLTANLVTIKDTTGKFLLPLPDGRIIDTKSWDTNDWEWTHGIGLYGIWQYYALTGEEDSIKLIEEWFTARLSVGGATKNINTMSPFLTLAYLYENTENATYLPWLDAWAEWAYYDLARTHYGGMQHDTYLGPNTQQLWDDTLMMTVLPLAKIGKLLNRPHYVDEAVRQFLLHIKYLFDPTTGLWFHGWQFTDECEKNVGHNFARALWARGNSWVTIVIPEFITLLNLPHSDPIRQHLLDTLEAQCAALQKYQTASGLWCTLIAEPEEYGSYVEASATAGFAYGMLMAVRKRYIGKEYEKVALKAIKGILQNISEDGELLNTSFGTGMGNTLQFYKDIPRTSMPYGQAMAIMALTEFLRSFI